MTPAAPGPAPGAAGREVPAGPPAPVPPPADLLRILRAGAGLDLATLEPAGAGESGAAFWVTGRGRHAGLAGLLKVQACPAARAPGYLAELRAVTGRLRGRGYPAPRLLGTGHAAGLAFWITERLPGAPAGPGTGLAGGALLARLLPELIRLNDAQAGLVPARPGRTGEDWPTLLTRTLTEGGDGYCLHSTLLGRADTREILRVVRETGVTCRPAIPPGGDFMHYDFTPANLLTDGARVTGVIDINPPVLSGDRAFDVATLLFYGYGSAAVRAGLTARLLALAAPPAARAYLAHIVLRQVDWSLRHHPAAPATGRHLDLARQVIAGIAAW